MLDKIADDLAKTLKADLDVYTEVLGRLEDLLDEKDTLESRIRRAKKAIELLTGTELPVKGFGGEEEGVVQDADTSGSGTVATSPIPTTPQAPTCPGCGTGELVNTFVSTSKGRRINVLQCSDSSCNSQYPT